MLDSSTENKFSRHVLVVLESLAFRDNRDVGRFVRDDVLPTMPDELRIRMSEYREVQLAFTREIESCYV